MPVPGMTPGIDQPSPARIYEYLTGGNDYFPADKALAERLTDPQRGYPGLRALARENRAFVLAAARWAGAMLGTGQFLDLGCGLPARPMVHDAARAAVPAAKVAYVDVDGMVVRHVRSAAAEEGWTGTAVLEGDAADPAAVLADQGLLELIDLGKPAAVILGCTLSAMSPEVARGAVAGYAEAMAPGSCEVISCVSYGDPGLAARMAGLFGVTGPWFNHSPADVASFFAAGGLRVIHGRPMDVRCWPACAAGETGMRGAAVLGGIGVLDRP